MLFKASLLTAMVTPFNESGDQIDYNSAIRLGKYLINHGSDGLVLNGTTGESSTTNIAEKIELLRVIKSTCGKDITVLGGICLNKTAEAIQLAKEYEYNSADGLMIVAPYYINPSKSDLIDHFRYIAKSVRIPIMVYDVPQRTGITLDVTTLHKLSQINNIVAVKDAKNDLSIAAITMSETNLQYYSGNDLLCAPLLSIGGFGAVSVLSHFIGPQMKHMFHILKNEKQDIKTFNKKIALLYRAVFSNQAAIMVKSALKYKNIIDYSTTRLPLSSPSEEEYNNLLTVLKEYSF